MLDRVDLGMLEGVLLGELNTVREGAVASMRAVHSSASAALHRVQQEHAQKQGWWQEREQQLLGCQHAQQQQLEALQSEKAHSETQLESWQMRHAQLVSPHSFHALLASQDLPTNFA